MDIRAALDREHNKAISQHIAEHIGDDAERFAELMRVMLRDSPGMVQRAAWPMGMACEAHPELATPWVPKMLDLLDERAHEAVHRNIVRTLQFCALPKKLHGRLTGTMFTWIADPRRPIAARASAITVAMRLIKLYPELASHLRLLLEEALRVDPGPAIHSRATNALTALGAPVAERPQR